MLLSKRCHWPGLFGYVVSSWRWIRPVKTDWLKSMSLSNIRPAWPRSFSRWNPGLTQFVYTLNIRTTFVHSISHHWRIHKCIAVQLRFLPVTWCTAVGKVIKFKCFYAVGWASGRASDLLEVSDEVLVWLSVWSECKWFPYDPAEPTATPSSLAPVKPRMVYLSGVGLPGLFWKRGH